MKLAKSLLLGSATAFVAVAGANAADLPSKKAAPATYVKVCDAYGAGFFNIPGTETCIKVGGRVRYDVGFKPNGNFFDKATGAETITKQDTWGQHVRGRVDLDARTPTAYGTVQSVVSMKLSQSTGLLGGKATPTTADVTNIDAAKYDSSSPSLEAAYIRFAGFTFGRAKELFSYGPSLSFGGNSRFPSFASGALQASYTAVLGGGFSATVGIEDNDAIKQQNLEPTSAPFATPYDKIPVVVGAATLTQGWGSFTASGSFAQLRSVKETSATSVTYDKTLNGYAFAGWLTLNADMITKGDKFYLAGGYANGINAHGFKYSNFDSSNESVAIDGIAQSYKNFTCNSSATSCDLTKSTWVSSAFTHYWNPSVRQNLMAGWAKVDPGAIATAASGATQKATFMSLGTNLIWSPTKDFDIGVETLYTKSNVSLNSALTNACTTNTASAGCKYSGNALLSRLRVERTF